MAERTLRGARLGGHFHFDALAFETVAHTWPGEAARVLDLQRETAQHPIFAVLVLDDEDDRAGQRCWRRLCPIGFRSVICGRPVLLGRCALFGERKRLTRMIAIQLHHERLDNRTERTELAEQ